MAEVLCVYREVQILKKAAAKSKKSGKRVAIVSYDEKPGIQAIATTKYSDQASHNKVPVGRCRRCNNGSY